MSVPLARGGRGSQEMPRSGGFPAFEYKKNLPVRRGPHGAVLFGAAAAVIVGGFYLVGQGNLERRADAEEARTARTNILACLQAEEDRRYVQQYAAQRAEEEEVMKNVPGWKVGESVYNSGKWMPPGNTPF